MEHVYVVICHLGDTYLQTIVCTTLEVAHLRKKLYQLDNPDISCDIKEKPIWTEKDLDSLKKEIEKWNV